MLRSSSVAVGVRAAEAILQDARKNTPENYTEQAFVPRLEVIVPPLIPLPVHARFTAHRPVAD